MQIYVLPMTYLNPRSAPLNDDMDRFTPVALNRSQQSKYFGDWLVCKLILVRSAFKDNIGSLESGDDSLRRGRPQYVGVSNVLRKRFSNMKGMSCVAHITTSGNAELSIGSMTF